VKDVTQSITIDHPAQEVFDFTIDPANTPKWVDGVVKEVTSEVPTQLGTIYKNQGRDGSWATFEITAFEPGSMFEMTKTGDSTHVRYTFKSSGNTQCKLVYYVWVDKGEVSERFSEDNIQKVLQNLKNVIEELV
jgi:uncharacterized protein YndB with AHSA1/START domain